ncbi:MAG: amidohydrolase family protein [Actinomycetota bacterium]
MSERTGRTLLVGGEVIDVRTGLAEPADVVVRGDRVTDVISQPELLPDDTVVDVSGLFLLPGLIDCHVHLVMRGDDADPSANARRSDEEIAALAAEAAERTLIGGITTVRDVGGWNYVEMALREEIQQGERVGPRLFLAGRLLSQPTEAVDYYPGMYEVASGPEAVAKTARNQLKRGADLIKVMATGAMLSPEGEDARAAQLGLEDIRAAVDAAWEVGAHVAAHAHALEGIRNAVLAGVGSIEHGTYADPKVLDLMAQRGVFLVPTLSPWTQAREDGDVMRSMPEHIRTRLVEAHEIHVEMIGMAAQRGVPIAMGTDAGTPGNHHGSNVLECVAMVEEAGISAEHAIRSATIDASRLLGRESELGSIEAGKLADIIAVGRNPIADIRALSDVRFVMKGGESVKLALD